MVIEYKNKQIDIDDSILQGDKYYRNQIIDEQYIRYAIGISTPDDFDESVLSEKEIKRLVERLIIADIGDVFGYEVWLKYGILASVDGNGNVEWKKI